MAVSGCNGLRCVINIACMYVCIKSSVMAVSGCNGLRCVIKVILSLQRLDYYVLDYYVA
jgi:hypothetical protein